MIEYIYEQLKEAELCRNEEEFSCKYLGKSKSYYSVIKSRQQNISIEALLYLEVMLKNTTAQTEIMEQVAQLKYKAIDRLF